VSHKGSRTGMARNDALAVGLAFYAVGAFFMWDAYEARGKTRPFGMRLVGGLV
jgi:hypothetical protein